MSALVLPPIIDAFTLNPAIRHRPGWYQPYALAALDVLRRANTYRPKQYVLPDDYNQPIPAYQTMNYQVRVAPKSYIWALLCNQFSAGFVFQTPSDVWVQITDSCTGVSFFSDFVHGTAFQGLQNVATDQRNAMLPHLLTQPRLILEPGLVAVDIANTAAVAARVQLVLFVAEPCGVCK
jgi:hypothetical protein